MNMEVNSMVCSKILLQNFPERAHRNSVTMTDLRAEN